MQFIGRTEELRLLNNLTYKKSASLVTIQGRRRIGKSRLVEEFAKPYTLIALSALAPSSATTAQSQRTFFAQQLSKYFPIDTLDISDWVWIFSFLAEKVQTKRVIILFDEISWMGSCDPDFVGKLKHVWDLEFKKNPKLILILCGSVSFWIEENIIQSTAFMGRLSLQIHLNELTLPESQAFLDAIGFVKQPYERLKMLSVTGGIPRYLEEIQPRWGSDENISQMCFSKNGLLFSEYKHIFTDIFGKKGALSEAIMQALVEGPCSIEKLSESTQTPTGGNFSATLQQLVVAGFIRRDHTWSLKSGMDSNLSEYRLCDNYIRFYLKYIEPNRDPIQHGHFSIQGVEALPGYYGIMGLQFENLLLNNRKWLLEALQIKSFGIMRDNPYFQRPTKSQKRCQLDYLIQLRSQILYAVKFKFSKSPIGVAVATEMKEKIENLKTPKRFAVIPILICANGASEALQDLGYFSQILSLDEQLGQ